MITLQNEFIFWYFNEFCNSDLFMEMSKMTEDSPWHRERNVGVHTNMVVSQYLSVATHAKWSNLSKPTNDKELILGAFAAAFHDVGKPASLIMKNNEVRGDYKAFHGHEGKSARVWENWAVTNMEMLKTRFQFTARDIYKVGWMIENHLPWGIKQKDKIENLTRTVYVCDIKYAYTALLFADTFGRMSDDATEKQANTLEWLANFCTLVKGEHEKKHNTYLYNDKPRIVVPIAPSGCGKSTLYHKEFAPTFYHHFSLDNCRIEFAKDFIDTQGLSEKEVYKVCWEFCRDNDNDFRKYWSNHLSKLISAKKNIYYDNTNLSRKVRRFPLTLAKQHGYTSVAMVLPMAYTIMIDRQDSRTDKYVPLNSIMRQLDALDLPSYGEFDNIRILEPQN